MCRWTARRSPLKTAAAAGRWSTKQPKWQLLFVLPNLLLKEGGSGPSQLDLGLEGLAIVSATDPRVVEIKEWSEDACRFLGSFHNGDRKPIIPSVLIVRNDWQSRLGQDPEPVISFRNAAALACILPVRTGSPEGAWGGPAWSDTFDLHPCQLKPDGSHWSIHTPALNKGPIPLDELSLTTDLGLSRPPPLTLDCHLAERLGHVWCRRYWRGQDKQKALRVFRSLESAYEALAIRFKNFASPNEVGLGTVPWATAVEVLASPGSRNVQKWDCTCLIDRGRRPCDPRLRTRKYWCMTQKEKRRYLTLPQRIYLHLHDARSKFVHGDKISQNLLAPFPNGAPLLSLASTVYRIALVSYLEEHWPVRDAWLRDLAGSFDYERHLLKAIDGGDGM